MPPERHIQDAFRRDFLVFRHDERDTPAEFSIRGRKSYCVADSTIFGISRKETGGRRMKTISRATALAFALAFAAAAQHAPAAHEEPASGNMAMTPSHAG